MEVRLFYAPSFLVRGSCLVLVFAKATVAKALTNNKRAMKNALNNPLPNNGINNDLIVEAYSFAKLTAFQQLSTYDNIPLWEREEIAEDAAVHVLGKLDRFNPNRGVKVTTWTFRVVERFVSNRTKWLKRRWCYMLDDRDDIDGEAGIQVPDKSPDPAEANEIRELVQTTLNSLPRKARQVAGLMLEDQTTEEITEQMQITDGALSAHVFRIRNEMDSVLRKNGYTDGPVRRTRDRGTQEDPAVLCFSPRLLQSFKSIKTCEHQRRTNTSYLGHIGSAHNRL